MKRRWLWIRIPNKREFHLIALIAIKQSILSRIVPLDLDKKYVILCYSKRLNMTSILMNKLIRLNKI